MVLTVSYNTIEHYIQIISEKMYIKLKTIRLGYSFNIAFTNLLHSM